MWLVDSRVGSGEAGMSCVGPSSRRRVVQAGGEGRRAGLGAAGPGLRVPPAAPPVLSGLRRGEVKGCRGPGMGWVWGGGREASCRVDPPSLRGGRSDGDDVEAKAVGLKLDVVPAVTSGGHRQRQQRQGRSPGGRHYNNKGNLEVNTGEEWAG